MHSITLSNVMNPTCLHSLPPPTFNLTAGLDDARQFLADRQNDDGNMILDAELVHLFSDVINKLITSVASQLETAEKGILPASVALHTMCDDMVGSAGPARAKVTKKHAKGRLRKWVGDMCLLVGSPMDAWDNYAAASLDLQGDPLWQAANQEGIGSAIVGCHMANQPPHVLEAMMEKDTELYDDEAVQYVEWWRRCLERVRVPY